jgi:CRP-like cAMP-binding protein
MERAFIDSSNSYYGDDEYFGYDDGEISVLGEHAVTRSRFSSAPVTTSSNLLLNSLPNALFKAIRPSLRSVFLEEDQYLYFQDGRLDYLYFPETAVISELRMLEDGRMVEVAITGREGAVGFSALFCSARAANCTQVSQAGSAVRIESSAFEKMLKNNSELAQMFSPQMDHYIRQISQRAICNMYHSVKERLCTWLLLVQDRCGKKTLKLTHEQIARILGVYRPSVTCIALEMRKNKLISYSRGGMSICDRGRMKRSACDCYMELAGAV